MYNTSVDIYSLIVEADKKKRINRIEILRSMGVTQEYFKDGHLKIDKTICRGVECKLCIKACPTNALYWEDESIKFEEELCIHCSACVLSCIVDDCIVITRRRNSGQEERFSTPKQAAIVNNKLSAKKRRDVVFNLVSGMESLKPRKE